ncbi:MAG: hypothetical protein IJO46_14185, partial [Thermoguttaceae bacterium]|nr:hypothetical protein [Thermoguttaceae bacterium]
MDSGDDDAIPVSVVCFLIALVDWFILAYKSHQKKTRRRLYANMIRDGARRVDDIAAATGLRYNVVKKDLRRLAKKGKDIFRNTYFNEATQEICLASPAAPAARWNNAPANAPATWNNAPANAPATWNNAPANAPAQPVAPRNVVCSACGASVTLVGDKRVCEYCG